MLEQLLESCTQVAAMRGRDMLEDRNCFGVPPSYSYHCALDLRCRSRPETPPFGDSWTPVRAERCSGDTVGRSMGALSNPPDSKSAQGGPAESSLTPIWPKVDPKMAQVAHKVLKNATIIMIFAHLLAHR